MSLNLYSNSLLRLMSKLLLLSSLLGVIAVAAQASDKPRLTLSQQAEQGRIDSKKTEQSQLEKARQAASDTSSREQEIIERQEPGEWQQQQLEKSQAQFQQRESRADKYLREAKEAAAKERKIEEK
ncbi:MULTISPECIES: hypothetical protein [unclassified Shewanella]|uniref:hypothetical protein n=1 Tax=unclassified Shewanella TaxID=196818 RepID=UPI001F53DC5B|nr:MULTISPECIES: hypothetical protein [unclassified Shewanella]MDO6618429.1 hypothetical protein [Shewanella sp. 6_MG-2023]MDO6640252.1 hypothetical protein [Shewanella sp. 5_MG-2023]MDO6679670.1 hypothetical protein [Shewanella sp. 4_MG-2023]MDO6774437.1 hypothetical protein [Shewanella sp. 3_MG-2023]